MHFMERLLVVITLKSLEKSLFHFKCLVSLPLIFLNVHLRSNFPSGSIMLSSDHGEGQKFFLA
jgi:hypothetical protein